MVNIINVIEDICSNIFILRKNRVTLNNFQKICNEETITTTSSTNNIKITRIGNVLRFNFSYSGITSSSGNITNTLVETAVFNIPKYTLLDNGYTTRLFNNISIYSPINTGITGGVTSLSIGSRSVDSSYNITMKVQVNAKHGTETTGSSLFYVPLTTI